MVFVEGDDARLLPPVAIQPLQDHMKENEPLVQGPPRVPPILDPRETDTEKIKRALEEFGLDSEGKKQVAKSKKSCLKKGKKSAKSNGVLKKQGSSQKVRNLLSDFASQ